MKIKSVGKICFLKTNPSVNLMVYMKLFISPKKKSGKYSLPTPNSREVWVFINKSRECALSVPLYNQKTERYFNKKVHKRRNSCLAEFNIK